MRIDTFSTYLKLAALMIIFMAPYKRVTAPTKDFSLRMDVFRAGIKAAEERIHALEYARFVTDLGYRESGNNWRSVNLIGCFGEWQFAESTVHYLGYRHVTLAKFRSDPEIFPPELQRKVLESLIKVNLVLMRKYESYIGDTVNGVPVTRSGMIAAAHLGGARSVRLFLSSGGALDKADVLGTKVSDYMKRFSFYDID